MNFSAPESIYRTFALLFAFALVTACKHPLAIDGEGDIVDANGSSFGCTLEQFNAGDLACAENDVQGDYFVNYRAVPRPGWEFVEWTGSCGHLSVAPNCRFDVPAVWVAFWDSDIGVPIPPLTAVFQKIAALTVSDVTGNTASLNAVAEFTVQLSRQPTATVTIPVASTDESEGSTEIDVLTFTPENWDQPQLVVVVGQNAAVQDGVQNYVVKLGDAISDDLDFNGFQAEVPMTGVGLTVAAPTPLYDLLAQVEARLQPQVVYTGDSQLSFSLADSPAGMVVDLNTGEISWTPAAEDGGSTFSVTVKVNDGSQFEEVTFTVDVAALEPINTTTSGETLTVSDGGTSLDGVQITAGGDGSGAIGDLALEKVPAESVPAIPDWITAITDAFYITGNFDRSVELRVPLPSLPAGTTLADVNLFGFVQPEDAEEQLWSSVLLDTRYEGTLDAPVVVISLENLSGMYLFGTKTLQTEAEEGGQAPARLRQLFDGSVSAAAVENVSCTPRNIPLSVGLNYREQDCTSTDNPAVNVFVKDFATTATSTRWNGTTIEMLVDWLVTAQGGFDDLGLAYDNSFNVVVEPMDYLGYVTTGNGENRRTLHITDANIAQNVIKGTAVHEYFHHAQGKLPQAGLDLLINGDARRSWLIEGTSRWFEDRLFDDIDTYIAKEGGTGDRILRPGLNAVGSAGALRSYQRFSFFKLLASRCPGFETGFNNLLNVDLATDPSGIVSLSAAMSAAGCNFGDHLGTDRAASLEAAMVYYQYATLSENSIALLDADESDMGFNFLPSTLRFDQTFYASVSEWLILPDESVHRLNNVGSLAPGAAISFSIPAVAGTLPDESVAQLTVLGDRELLVSITSKDASFNGDTQLNGQTHTWFSTTEKSTYTYDSGGSMPELFVTIVNPSFTNAVDTEVNFQVRGELSGDAFILSPVQGALVDNRVISVIGVIPEGSREGVDRVVVNSNGIPTETNMAADGSFSALVVIGVGNNIIRAQAFAGGTAATNESVLTVTGMENPAGGSNALVASRVVFVLRWDTGSTDPFDPEATDLDIYSIDKNGGLSSLDGVLYWGEPSVGPGNLDADNVSGFGPEVISYRDVEDPIYIDGSFNVDVHYYSGTVPTRFSLDVILNETDGANRRFLKFESLEASALFNAMLGGINITGDARFDDVVEISCSSEGICSLATFDATRVAEAGSLPDAEMAARLILQPAPPESTGNALHLDLVDACYAQRQAEIAKRGSVDWHCREDGGRTW